MGKLLRHRQTKGPVSASLYLNCRPTPRLHPVDPLVSEAGTPSGLRRERSLRAYDGVVNVVGNPSPTISSVPEPLPPRGPKGVKFRAHFMRPFAPCFGRLVAGAQVYLLTTLWRDAKSGMDGSRGR